VSGIQTDLRDSGVGNINTGRLSRQLLQIELKPLPDLPIYHWERGRQGIDKILDRPLSGELY